MERIPMRACMGLLVTGVTLAASGAGAGVAARPAQPKTHGEESKTCLC
jgi:hypothetical protein